MINVNTDFWNLIANHWMFTRTEDDILAAEQLAEYLVADAKNNRQRETSLADELRAAMFEEDDDDE